MRSSVIFYPGDLVLLRGQQSTSKGLVTAQKFLFGSNAPEYSHVAISLGYDVFIHAVSKGVSLVPFSEIFSAKKYRDNWKVIRNKHLSSLHSEDLSDGDEFRKRCFYYVGQPYNYKFFIKNEKDASKFCSELAARVYEQYQIHLSTKPSYKTTPFDIQMLLKSPEWEEVTEEYRTEYAHLWRNNENESSSPKGVEITSNEDDVSSAFDELKAPIQQLTANHALFLMEVSREWETRMQELKDKTRDNPELKSLNKFFEERKSILDFWDTRK